MFNIYRFYYKIIYKLNTLQQQMVHRPINYKKNQIIWEYKRN